MTIEPVGMIESGKTKTLEGRPIASQMNHRLSLIYDSLKKDLGEQYSILKQAGVSIPSFSVGGAETFQLVADSDVSFEVSVFKFDIAGLMAYLRGKLDARDQVKALIEIGSPKSRLFLEVSRIKGADRSLILESGPTLNDAIDTAACAVAHAYREQDGLFSGLDTESFCKFLDILKNFQNYVVRSANIVTRGGQIDLAEARRFVTQLEAAPFDRSNSPVVHLILASLYRISGDKDAALDRIEKAAALVPEHEFVVVNLEPWRTEKAEREADVRQIASTRNAPPDTVALESTYQTIRAQPALASIRYPEMLAHIAAQAPGSDVTVAVLSTGFTYPAEPLAAPRILDLINVTGEPATDDLNGHGNMVTHLLGALLPIDGLKILPVKVLTSGGTGTNAMIADGIVKAADQGSDVLAIPLGGIEPSKVIEDAVGFAAGMDGAMMLAAAGNSGRTSDVNYPAAFPEVVSVGGTTEDGDWAMYSPGPAGVDVPAPSMEIQTTLTGNESRSVNGTSFSVVIVSALFAIARSVAPDLSQAEILGAMQATARQQGADKPPVIDALAFIERVEELSRQ